MNRSKQMYTTINFSALRYAFSIAISIVMAFFVDQYFIANQFYWVVFSAFLVNQASLRMPIRVAARYFLLILFSYIFAYGLLAFFHQSIAIFFVVAVIFIFCGYRLFTQQFSIMTFNLYLIPLLVMLLTLFSPQDKIPLQNGLGLIFLGALLGIVVSRLIFPMQPYKELKLSVLPVLMACEAHAQAIAEYFLVPVKEKIVDTRFALEKILLNDIGDYPEWIYEVGFNPGLRASFRFFLIQIEKIIELLFSLEYLIGLPLRSELLLKMNAALSASLISNVEMISLLIHYFNEDDVKTNDLTTDMIALENTLREMIPNIELLDISADYVILTAMVRDIKDMRKILLQLLTSLPDVALKTATAGSQTLH